jgi:predicted acyltransferase
MNAITVYLASSMLTILLNTYTVIRPDGAPETLKAFIYEDFFASWAGPMKGSLLFALAYMLIWLGPMAALYRKGIHIKI